MTYANPESLDESIMLVLVPWGQGTIGSGGELVNRYSSGIDELVSPAGIVQISF